VEATAGLSKQPQFVVKEEFTPLAQFLGKFQIKSCSFKAFDP